jgi:hypothetical protein
MSISQQDINVRLQLTGCAYSKLANEFANNLKYGRKCSIDNEKTLLLLNAYIELIECYKLDSIEIKSIGYYNVETVFVSLFDTYEAYIDGVLMAGPLSILDYTELAVFIDTFNTNASIYFPGYSVAYVPSALKTIELAFSGPCSGGSVTMVHNLESGSETTVVELTGGVCKGFKYNNCISETQLLNMFDNISKITGICFQPIGFAYTPILIKDRDLVLAIRASHKTGL